MLLVPLGNSMLVSLPQSLNAKLLIVSSRLPSAKVTLSKFEQLWNALSSMEITLAGIFTLSNFYKAETLGLQYSRSPPGSLCSLNFRN